MTHDVIPGVVDTARNGSAEGRSPLPNFERDVPFLSIYFSRSPKGCEKNDPGVLCERQGKVESAAPANLAFGPDTASVSFDKHFGNVQAETKAFRSSPTLGSVEAIEDA